MTSIIRLITTHANWLYLGSALVFLIFSISFLRSRRSRKEALFGLELEVASARLRRAVRLMLLSAIMAAAVLLITTTVEPRLPAPQQVDIRPTPNIFITPPPTFTNITPSPTATLTPTLAAATTIPQVETTDSASEPSGGTIEATTEPISPTIQPPGAICEIKQPADGSAVNGEISFIGSATSDNFLFYKLEAYGPETGSVWASIIGDVAETAVVDGVLGTANFTGWVPGGYSMRVVVVDDTSNEVAVCYISVTVTGQ